MTEQDLWDGIERNNRWIKKQCYFAEKYHNQKRMELIQDAQCRIVSSLDAFLRQDIRSVDAWVKRVTQNAITAYIADEVRHKEGRKKLIENHDSTIKYEPDSQASLDIDRIIKFVNETFSSRDQQIMYMCLVGESHMEIAEIVEMTSKSVTNRIVQLKKLIKDYMKKGDRND